MRAACGCSVGAMATRSIGVITVAAILCAGALTAAHAGAGVEASSTSDVASPVVAGSVRLNELWAMNLGVAGANVAEALLADLDGDGIRDAIVTMGKGRESSTVIALELEGEVEIWRADYAGAVHVLEVDPSGLSGGGGSDVFRVQRSDSERRHRQDPRGVWAVRGRSVVSVLRERHPESNS